MNRLLLLFHTLRHLTLKQLCYRGVRLVVPRLSALLPCGPLGRLCRRLRERREARRPTYGSGRPDRELRLLPWPDCGDSLDVSSITLLGRNVALPPDGRIDYREIGRDALFQYLLSGHRYLLSPSAESETVSRVVSQAAEELLSGSSAGPLMVPHPVSLRLIHWCRLYSLTEGGGSPRIGEMSEAVLQATALQLRFLLRRVENETDGNHLIDNAIGLLYGGSLLLAYEASSAGGKVVQGAARRSGAPSRVARRALRRGWDLLRVESAKQILSDGAHFELAGVYHLSMTERLLDAINLLGNRWIREMLEPRTAGRGAAVTALHRRAKRMLRWSRRNAWGGLGPAPVSDTLFELAPSLREILAYAQRLGLSVPAGEGGDVANRSASADYELLRNPGVELFFDRGRVGAERVPGHAHSDTLQLLLRLSGRDVLVDTGTSVYGNEPRRHLERSTGAHNTVVCGGKDQSEVWGSFRIARRATGRSLTEAAFEERFPASPECPTPADGTVAGSPGRLGWSFFAAAEHDGYGRYGLRHGRGVWYAGEGSGARAVLLRDLLEELGGGTGRWGEACFILSPELYAECGEGISARSPGHGIYEVGCQTVVFRFSPGGRQGTIAEPLIEAWSVAAGYRKQVETVRIRVPFFYTLETQIYER